MAKKKRTKKFVVIACVCAVSLWLIAGAIDFFRVIYCFEKPLFCVGTDLKDGDLGHYVGLGYSFDIGGNFIPEYEDPRVDWWNYYLFGYLVASVK